MGQQYSHEERKAVEFFRERFSGESQRQIAWYALNPLSIEPTILKDNGRSFQSIYHAVRRYDQEQKKANEIAQSQQAANTVAA